MSIWKIHHGIQKSTALQDYSRVKDMCVKNGYPVIEPKGEHWHKIEDATVEMIRALKVQEMDALDLNRGVDYYIDLQNRPYNKSKTPTKL